ncbi:hypothetical protein [Pedobacter alpinus]|uniref:hypothetical protein n=1 Tax=Pedobacter alpinus TaxID=1590643 RepID=UPI00366F0AE7
MLFNLFNYSCFINHCSQRLTYKAVELRLFLIATVDIPLVKTLSKTKKAYKLGNLSGLKYFDFRYILVTQT